MKKAAFVFVIVFFLSFLFPLKTTAIAPSPDYMELGDAEISANDANIAIFIAKYNQNTLYFTPSEQQQIESQYKGLQQSLSIIHDNLSKDTGVNLRDDYLSIDSGLLINEIKLPILYSELFSFKAAYLQNKFSKISESVIPQIANVIPDINQNTLISLNNQIITNEAQINTNQQNISQDYSVINTLATNSPSQENTQNMKTILQDIEKNQIQMLQSIDNVSQEFQSIITLN